MATYEIKFATSAAKEFRSLSTELRYRIGAAIDGLSQNPHPPGVRKLVGHEHLYRIRVGPIALCTRLTASIDAMGRTMPPWMMCVSLLSSPVASGQPARTAAW